MDRSRRLPLVSGVAILSIVIVVLAAALYWRVQQGRLDDMRAAVTSFEAPEEWVGWTRVEVTSRDYSPFCIDVACPSYSERYVAAVPEGDVGAVLETAIEAIAAGPVTAPERRCAAGARCLYTVDGTSFAMHIVLDDPFGFERGTVSDMPVGFVEVTITLHAF